MTCQNKAHFIINKKKKQHLFSTILIILFSFRKITNCRLSYYLNLNKVVFSLLYRYNNLPSTLSKHWICNKRRPSTSFKLPSCQILFSVRHLLKQ